VPVGEEVWIGLVLVAAGALVLEIVKMGSSVENTSGTDSSVGELVRDEAVGIQAVAKTMTAKLRTLNFFIISMLSLTRIVYVIRTNLPCLPN
jgi:hypothetical protein